MNKEATGLLQWPVLATVQSQSGQEVETSIRQYQAQNPRRMLKLIFTDHLMTLDP